MRVHEPHAHKVKNRPASKARASAKVLRRDLPRPTTIHVTEPYHLCGVQMVTRELCRAIGFGEAGVFQAVIAVSELAHRHLIETARPGKVELSVIRMREGLGLEARVAGTDESGEPAEEAMLTFSPGAGPLMS